jgi:hypothetical protein
MVVLAERDDRLSGRVASARQLATDRLGVDPQLRELCPPSVWLEGLPASHPAACRLVAELATM